MYHKFTFDFSNSHEISKVLTRQISFEWSHVSDSKGRATFYYTVNSTKESTAQCLSFEWPLIRPGFPVGAAYYVYTVALTFES